MARHSRISSHYMQEGLLVKPHKQTVLQTGKFVLWTRSLYSHCTMVSVKVLGALLLLVAVSCSLAAPVSVGEKTSVSFSSSRVSVKTSVSQKESRKDEPVQSQEDQPAIVGESVLPVNEEVNLNDKEDHVEGSGQPLSQNTVVEQRDLDDMDAAFSTHDFFGVLPGPYLDVIDDSGRGFFGDSESNPFKLYLS